TSVGVCSMKLRYFGCCVLTLVVTEARAAASYEVVSNVGSVLAAEEFCGLNYDQPAIAAYIEKNVPADDMTFASSLNMQVIGVKAFQKEMSASQKTAHCTQIARVAKSYGFTK
ncbi:hypothetical protein, partial [Pseudomonas syringae group sp. J309-1]